MSIPLMSALVVSFALAAGPASPQDDVAKELIDLCNRWLDDYSNGRADEVAALFAPGAVVAIDAVDGDQQRILPAAEFMAIVRQSLAEGKSFREWLVGEPTVLVDHKIATVWAPYLVESPGRKAGGIDVFQFVQLDGEWRIVSLSYTNKKVDDPSPAESAPPELGRVVWSRDLEATLSRAGETGRPALLLFQEIPG